MTKEEFKILFQEYYNPLCNFAKKIVVDDSKAEDAVQDVFVKLWHSKDKLNTIKYPKTYLFQATRYKCIEYLRKQTLDRELSKENEKRIELSSSLSTDEEADKYLLKEKLYKSIRQLPPKCQEVFAMSKINGLTYAEIAAELDIATKTVENHIGKALRLLREMMNNNK